MLVVEDDGQVRDVALAILRRHGYLVIAACDGDEAWQSCQAHAHPIHLLLTDLVMPGITGRELAHRLRGIRPDPKVLCMSGYDAVEAGEDPDITYLQKPFTAIELVTAVRRVLDTEALSTRRQIPDMQQNAPPGFGRGPREGSYSSPDRSIRCGWGDICRW